jgi:hypothetical protein
VKKLVSLTLAVVVLFALLTGCGDKNAAPSPSLSPSPRATATTRPSATPKLVPTPTPEPVEEVKELSTEVNQLYLNKNFMLEMLINDDCEISEQGGGLVINATPGNSAIGLAFFPGMQNLESSGQLIYENFKTNNPDCEVTEIGDALLFGARGKRFSFNNATTAGVVVTTVVNQSMYAVQVVFGEGTNDAEAELLLNVFQSINILQPVQVNQETQEATYEPKYKDVAPAPKYQQAYEPVEEWYYPPYYYYSWWEDESYYSDYPEYFFEPDWDYYNEDDYWSWGWDEYDDWGFYDDYGDYYDYSYYDYFDDYYDEDYYNYYGAWYDDEYYEPNDYDFYDDYYGSDPGDGDDYYSDPGDYGYDDEYYEPNDYDFDDDYYEPNDYDFYDDYYESNDYDF